jgi:hypothetical protein
MGDVAAILVPMTAAPAPPAAERREAARKIASATLIVALIGVVTITCLVLVLMQRTRRRLTDGARARRTRHSDAWAEAGRRAGSPPAEAFESDAGTEPGASEPEGPRG